MESQSRSSKNQGKKETKQAKLDFTNFNPESEIAKDNGSNITMNFSFRDLSKNLRPVREMQTERASTKDKTKARTPLLTARNQAKIN